ncbi:50S ribosomal protein L7/L12 [Microcoleus sp. FACHB-672]|uniref:50S ribosomal protein L7/L12 n=1 Tax=Microcoleus sp. FACHB-672 TaxID=2692825 RepID=UPI001684D626|nr:50S ribosomal protein L7/L12 [Microcoleus sp. FACHB-672]MBD2039183.1 50S ribosomal protein L7/L12 [Microcoleus sp. FACHB-672]
MSIKNVEILEQLKTLTMLETTELVKRIEETFNVDASTPKLIVPVLPGKDDFITDEPLEQTEFTVFLQEVPADKKIAILKAVREILSLDLKGAKDFVDSAPQVVKYAINLQDAEEIKQKLEAAGAKVSIY